METLWQPKLSINDSGALGSETLVLDKIVNLASFNLREATTSLSPGLT
jgi:hypothetical protein